MVNEISYISFIKYQSYTPVKLQTSQDLFVGIFTGHQVLQVGKLQTAKRSEPRNSWNWYNLT